MLISLAILLIVFYATDDLLGDKEFSEYTREDWSIAILPLSIIIVATISTLVFSLIIIISSMFSFINQKSIDHTAELPPIELPLTNIQEIDEAGILYLDNEGNSANIHYVDAYKGWCKSKNIKKSKPEYICDRTKYDGWKLIFYTNPQISFYTDPSKEELWNDIINKISLQGYRIFDWD